jgi:hypothetical protein|nr:MAG TPA: Large polyvalent protein-associated domain 3 [Bacteriophage sp.]
MAVKMPDLVAYGERVNKTQNNSGGVQMPNLVAYGKRVETRKAKETKAVTPSVSPRPMENASTGNSRPNSRLLADVRTGGTTPPSLDNGRVGKVISGAAKSTGSAYANLGGVLAEGAGKLNTRIANQNAGDSLQSDHDAVKRYEKMLRDVKWANGKAMTAADVKQVQSYLASAKRRIAAHEGYTKAVERSDKAVADKAYQKADRLSQSSAADVAQAKEGLGPVGQFAVDLGVQGVQMAGDVAASAVIPGAGLALMTARSAGSSAQRARQAGATYGQQLAYGLGSGALSLATEKISNVASPFKKAFGGGVLDNAINGALSKLNNSAAGRVALSMISEGGEEFIEDIFQPILQRATYDPSARFDLSEALYDAAVGAAMGGIGAGVDVIRQRGNGQANAQPTQEVRPEVREGTYTPAPANAAEGTQNAAPGVETAENIRVGQATTIKKPYKGEVPTQTQRQNTAPVQVSSEALTRAQNSIAGARGLESSLPGQSFKSTLKNVYKSIFKPATGVVVDGTSFGGQPYAVDIPNSVPGKVISDTNLTAEKLALLDNLPDVVRNGTYVGSGEYVPHGSKAKKTVRFDYFEAPVEINGKQYIASFDVEAFPDVNNYRTHKLNEIELSPMTNADTGRDPAANAMRTVPVEGTRPLNANDSIAQGAENVKNGGAAEFDTPGDAVAGAVNTPFDTMQAKSEDFYPVNPNSAQRIQADQRRAPSEVPTVNPDTGRNVEKTVSTILNSPLTSPEMATVYENAIAGGAFDYDVVTDRSAVQQAQAKIARDGWREVANSFIAKAELGQRITKADTAEAISAYNLAISEGDHKAAFELATAIADAAHDSAQMVQAMNLMNRLTPEGRLLTLRRLVDKMNDRAARQNRAPQQNTPDSGDVEGARVDYIDKVTGFTLSDELATNYLMAETDAERAAAWDAITTSIADQIPSTFREKANFWRYTSMLTNPTTHIRNIMGNAIQFGARKIKDGIGTAIERAVIKDPSQRTKAVNVDKDLKAFAKGQYETDQSAAMGSGKYSDATAAGIEREIQSKRKMFRGEDGLSRAVQGIGDLNSRALDYEDVIFNRSAYVDSFAQALQAKGVTAAEAHAGTRAADVEAARAYAIEEAQKATYRNTTALSEALSQFGRYEGDNPVKRAGSFVADALFPFRKTPANILTTGLDYSPVGLAKGVKEAMLDVKSGKCTAADAVDSIASGLTGTGILALGAYLAAEGLLHVRAGDDDKEEAFEKSMGKQDYAIQIGNKSYTLDWAVPAAMPLFAGAAIMESVRKGGGTFDALVDSLLGMQDVVLETSMLSSLNDLVSNISYAKSKPMYLIDRAASSYAGQYIPTIGSKVASVFDDTVRKSYVEKGSGQVASDVNYFLQGAAKKVPGARNQLQPMVDMWGNEVSNGSAPERVFQSFLSPGFLKAQDNSPATQEIRRLAKATGDSTVYPAAAEKSYTVKGETRTLTGEEYTRYAKAMGQTRKELVEAAVKLPAYKSMSNAEKADYIQNVYKYARETARQQVDPKYEPSAKWIENAKTSKRDVGVSTGEFLALYQKYGSEKMSGKAYEKVKQAHDAGLSPKEYFSMKDRADANGNGRVSKAEASAALAGQENRADLWDIICTTNAKNPYK